MEEKKSFQLAREVAWYFFWFCVQGNKGGSQVEGFLSLLKKKKICGPADTELQELCIDLIMLL